MAVSNQQEKLVPLSQALRMLRMGAEAQAGLFVGAYWRLKDMMGAERTRAILREAMCDAYTRLGREVAREVGRTDARGMAQAWELLYGAPVGGEGTVELEDDLWILEGRQCAAYDLMKRWGLSDREIRDLEELRPDKFEHKEWVALAWARDWALFRGELPDPDLVREFESLYTEKERHDILAVVTTMDFANRFMNTLTGKVLDLGEGEPD